MRTKDEIERLINGEAIAKEIDQELTYKDIDDKIEKLLGNYLWNTISIRDTSVVKEKKDNFYHGILLGLLGYKDTWLIKSNAESGIGYSDILIEVLEGRIGIAIENIITLLLCNRMV